MGRKITLSQDLRWEKLKSHPFCRKCGQLKTINDFPRKAVDYSCNDCRRIYAREAYHIRRAKLTDEWLASLSPEELAAYRREINAGNTERRLQVRHEVYMAYGGYICACCGETERHFLSIDHVNNDGAEHKREYKLHTGEQLYRWLRRNGFPSGFQVLCMNCQWGKRNNNGICPHKVRCNDHPARE